MKKLRQFILTDKSIKKMRDKIKRNETLKRELGFSIFQKNNVLIDRWHCIGNKYFISPSDKCLNGEELVGGFHTHPEANSEPSLGDLLNAYSEGLEIIGGFLDQKIVCYIRKVEFDNAHLDDIKLTRKKVIDLFYHMKAIEKIKPKYRDEHKSSEIINRYKETKHKEMCRILGKYFEVIDI